DVAALAAALADGRDRARYTSTQEDAWTLVAAAALAREAAGGQITIDGEALTGSAYRRYDQEDLNQGDIVVANTSNQPTEVKLSVAAIPEAPPPAASAGFTIARAWYLPDGTPFDPAVDPVTQNDRFVVVLSLAAEALGSGQYIVADPLPAGFEIENPDLAAGAGVGDFAWLTVDTPAHAEARTDAYVAAFRFVSETRSFSTAYMVRATSPGSFVLPGATVEDMYRPERRANTDAGRLDIAAAAAPAAPAQPGGPADKISR
ncbi:MAG TPA: alpha-2-macroglobulin family protein, partial [Devosia sp.]